MEDNPITKVEAKNKFKSLILIASFSLVFVVIKIFSEIPFQMQSSICGIVVEDCDFELNPIGQIYKCSEKDLNIEVLQHSS